STVGALSARPATARASMRVPLAARPMSNVSAAKVGNAMYADKAIDADRAIDVPVIGSLALLAREVRAERAQVVVAELGRAEERHRVEPAAHDDFHEIGCQVGALLELGRFRALVARLQRLRAGHRRHIRRPDAVLWDRGVARDTALLKHFAAA